ncbi:MAG: hypothetical protein R2822_04140 [Spirosomataceae bacterium]
MALALPLTAILKVIFDAIDPLKPYGFLLGEPEATKERVTKNQAMKKIEKEVTDTIIETTNEVSSMFRKKELQSRLL